MFIKSFEQSQTLGISLTEFMRKNTKRFFTLKNYSIFLLHIKSNTDSSGKKINFSPHWWEKKKLNKNKAKNDFQWTFNMLSDVERVSNQHFSDASDA